MFKPKNSKRIRKILVLLVTAILVLSTNTAVFAEAKAPKAQTPLATKETNKSIDSLKEDTSVPTNSSAKPSGSVPTKVADEDFVAKNAPNKQASDLEIKNMDEEESKETEKENDNLDSVYEIEFGSYPQREVVAKASDSGVYGKVWENDDDLIVDENLYNTLNSLSETVWDENGDATLDGCKYRRIKASDATYSTSSDANYYDWVTSETYHYFKYEPIKWLVLKQEGNEALVLSEIVLDDQMYNTKITNITWQTSTIRSWLNGYDSSANVYGTDYSNSNFVNTAFSSAEQAMINSSTIENADNIKNGTDGGEETTDKIFLLSENETYGDDASSYGFVADYNADDELRQAKSSTYAKAMGTFVESESATLGNSFWWLRSPGAYTGLFVLTRCDGSVYRGGQHANSKTRGVRPAMYITLE